MASEPKLCPGCDQPYVSRTPTTRGVTGAWVTTYKHETTECCYIKRPSARKRTPLR